MNIVIGIIQQDDMLLGLAFAIIVAGLFCIAAAVGDWVQDRQRGKGRRMM